MQGHVGSSFNNPLWGLTGAGGQEPAVQVSCRQREVEHQRPLPIHSVQDVLHGHGRVGVRVLLARLSLHQQVGKGPSASALRHGQSFIMVTWAEVRGQRWSSETHEHIQALLTSFPEIFLCIFNELQATESSDFYHRSPLGMFILTV